MTANMESAVSLSDVDNWELTLTSSVGRFRGSECLFEGSYRSVVGPSVVMGAYGLCSDHLCEA